MGTELQVYTNNQKLELWAERVRECRSSGMTVSAWCEANQINKYTYYEWQRKVFKAAKEAAEGPEFAEVIREEQQKTLAKVKKQRYEVEITSIEALLRILEC